MKKEHIRLIIVAGTILSIICLFLPFRIETTLGGRYQRLFGGYANADFSQEVLNAFDFPIVLVATGFILVSTLCSFYSSKKYLLILAFVISGLNIAFMLLLNFLLRFHLHLFGPSVKVEPGFGYYVLFGISLVLFISHVAAYKISVREKKRPEIRPDLLDDF